VDRGGVDKWQCPRSGIRAPILAAGSSRRGAEGDARIRHAGPRYPPAALQQPGAGRHGGGVWRDPERVDEWIGELSKSEPVVTFCVYGFHIGCETAATLRKAGFDARYMAGGHFAWKASKGAVRRFE
jgi:rhodanese-related sulfurtransferase